jgi:hypothetical protein
LLRCVSRRRGGFSARGRLASSWVARAFGIDLRRVKQARAELVSLGWLSPEPSEAWSTNRWGSAWTVDLGWAPPSRGDCHPSPTVSGASLPPPESDPAPLRGQSDPEPAGRGPTGAVAGTEGETTHSKRTPRPSLPDLRDIRPEDLADTGRALDLHAQAVARGTISPSEADRVRFVAAIEHARAVGRANPPGLLARIVSTRAWHLLSQRDEDRAARRLRDYRHLGPALTTASTSTSRLATSSPIRSPYGSERQPQEPIALAELLARLTSSACLSSVRNTQL